MAKINLRKFILAWILAAGFGFLTFSSTAEAGESGKAATPAETSAPGEAFDPYAGLGDASSPDAATGDDYLVEAEEDDDPFEGYNRFMSGFNRIVRKIIIDPLVDGYQAIMPDPVEDAISNAASNAAEPITAGSSLLQGDLKNAANSAGRFIVNTTVGLGGTSDRASEMGIEARKTDPGLAAGAQGVEPGAHIVLPILGPSNLRDAPGDIGLGLVPGVGIAKAVDSAATYSEYQDEIKSLSEDALDPYSVEKAAYEQYRAEQVRRAREALGKEAAAKAASSQEGMDVSP